MRTDLGSGSPEYCRLDTDQAGCHDVMVTLKEDGNQTGC